MKTSLFALALLTLLTACQTEDPGRRAWLQSTLVEDNRALLERAPELTADKFRKMASRPYYWFRGNMAVFLGDAGRPGPGFAPSRFTSAESSRVLLVGDPHPENLGSFRLADGEMVLEYNDFDAAEHGPFVSDVRRLALGFAVALAESGGDAAAIEAVAAAAVRGYRAEIEALAAGEAPLDARRGDDLGKIADDLLRRGQRDGDAGEALAEYTRIVDGRRIMFEGDVEAPLAGLITDRVVLPTPTEVELVERLMADYPATLAAPRPAAFFAIKGITRRLGAGVSSYPLRRWYVLVEGDTTALEDDRILELKELPDPPRPDRRPHLAPRGFTGNGARVAFAQRALHLTPDRDPLLGWAARGAFHARVRERTKYQKGIEVDRIAEKLADGDWDQGDVADFARLAGRLLARGHALAPTLDGHPGLGPIAAVIDRDRAGFVTETVDFVMGYHPQVEADFDVFCALVEEEGPWLGYRPSALR